MNLVKFNVISLQVISKMFNVDYYFFYLFLIIHLIPKVSLNIPKIHLWWRIKRENTGLLPITVTVTENDEYMYNNERITFETPTSKCICVCLFRIEEVISIVFFAVCRYLFLLNHFFFKLFDIAKVIKSKLPHNASVHCRGKCIWILFMFGKNVWVSSFFSLTIYKIFHNIPSTSTLLGNIT